MLNNSLLILSLLFLIFSQSPTVYSSTHARKEFNQNNIEQQEEKKTFQEIMKERKDLFRKELTTIKDDRKRNILERINDNLASRNQKWTTHFNNVLKQLSEVLEKIKDRSQKAQKNGKDISEIQKALQDAQNAMNEAQEAVNIQSAKDYTIKITDEASAREAMITAKDQLKADLKIVQKKIKIAREAVHTAAITLGKNL